MNPLPNVQGLQDSYIFYLFLLLLLIAIFPFSPALTGRRSFLCWRRAEHSCCSRRRYRTRGQSSKRRGRGAPFVWRLRGIRTDTARYTV